MGAEYKVHTKLLTEFETLGVMGENNSGIIIPNHRQLPTCIFVHNNTFISGSMRTPRKENSSESYIFRKSKNRTKANEMKTDIHLYTGNSEHAGHPGGVLLEKIVLDVAAAAAAAVVAVDADAAVGGGVCGEHVVGDEAVGVVVVADW